MCEHLHYESVYFKELHKEQEYYRQSGGSCSVNYYQYNIIEAIYVAVNLNFYYCSVRSKQYASILPTIFFYLRVMLLSWNWEKVYSSRLR